MFWVAISCQEQVPEKTWFHPKLFLSLIYYLLSMPGVTLTYFFEHLFLPSEALTVVSDLGHSMESAREL